MAVRTARRRGMTLIEVLVALLILGMSLAALVSLWSFSFGITGQTDDTGIGYNIARRSIEAIRETGFRYTPVGTLSPGPVNPDPTGPVLYVGDYILSRFYDVNGGSESATQTGASTAYRAVTIVRTFYATSSTTSTGVIYMPSDDAYRSVRVSVFSLRTGRTVSQTGTMLVRSGV